MKATFGQGPSRHIPIPGKVPVCDPGHEVGSDKPLGPASNLTIRWKVMVGRRRRRSLTPHPVRRRCQRLNLQAKNRSNGTGGIQDRVDDLVGGRRRSWSSGQLRLPSGLALWSREIQWGAPRVNVIKVGRGGSRRIVFSRKIWLNASQGGEARGLGITVSSPIPRKSGSSGEGRATGKARGSTTRVGTGEAGGSTAGVGPSRGQSQTMTQRRGVGTTAASGGGALVAAARERV